MSEKDVVLQLAESMQQTMERLANLQIELVQTTRSSGKALDILIDMVECLLKRRDGPEVHNVAAYDRD